jgi:hypothetical protein
MANVKGRGVTVAISATYSSAVVVTGVTKANPGVATTAGTAPANDIVGYWDSVVGMSQLDKQATRTKNRTATTWELQGLNTTNYATFTSGNFIAVATWATLSESTSYSLGGGSSEKLDVTTLLDIVRKEELGLLPVQSVTMNVIAQDTPSTAMQLLETAVQTQAVVVVRITLPNGAVRIFTADPGTPGEDVQQGAVGTGSLDMAVKGFILKLAA